MNPLYLRKKFQATYKYTEIPAKSWNQAQRTQLKPPYPRKKFQATYKHTENTSKELESATENNTAVLLEEDRYTDRHRQRDRHTNTLKHQQGAGLRHRQHN